MWLFIILIVLIILYLYRDYTIKEKYVRFEPCRDKTEKNILTYNMVLKPTADIKDNNLKMRMNGYDQPGCSGINGNCSIDENRGSCPTNKYTYEKDMVVYDQKYDGGNSSTYCPTCPMKRQNNVYPIPGFDMV